MVSLGNVMAPVGVSLSTLMCYSEHILRLLSAVEVDLSAILDPRGSHQFMSCPQAMSFFQMFCPAPFPPVSPGDVEKGLRPFLTLALSSMVFCEHSLLFTSSTR